MVMWLNVPRPPCFRGMVMKNVAQSLENTGSSDWETDESVSLSPWALWIKVLCNWTISTLYSLGCSETKEELQKLKLPPPEDQSIKRHHASALVFTPKVIQANMTVSLLDRLHQAPSGTLKPPHPERWSSSLILTLPRGDTAGRHSPGDRATSLTSSRVSESDRESVFQWVSGHFIRFGYGGRTLVQWAVVTSHRERSDIFWARLTQRTLSLSGVTHFTMVM